MVLDQWSRTECKINFGPFSMHGELCVNISLLFVLFIGRLYDQFLILSLKEMSTIHNM